MFNWKLSGKKGKMQCNCWSKAPFIFNTNLQHLKKPYLFSAKSSSSPKVILSYSPFWDSILNCFLIRITNWEQSPIWAGPSPRWPRTSLEMDWFHVYKILFGKTISLYPQSKPSDQYWGVKYFFFLEIFRLRSEHKIELIKI